jgi:hypothetical protein
MWPRLIAPLQVLRQATLNTCALYDNHIYHSPTYAWTYLYIYILATPYELSYHPEFYNNIALHHGIWYINNNTLTLFRHRSDSDSTHMTLR